MKFMGRAPRLRPDLHAIFNSHTLDDREALVYHGSIVAGGCTSLHLLDELRTDLQRGDIRKVVASDDIGAAASSASA